MNLAKPDKKPFWHFWTCEHCIEPQEATRNQLLMAALEEIMETGFQSASIGRILKRTGVTKGALYHYFPSKTELGYAVLDEIIGTQVHEFWIAPLQDGNPIDVITGIIEQAGKQMTLDDIRLGCPLANLSQEMSPLDEGFRQRLDALYGQWRGALRTALERGQQAGQVRPEIDAEGTAIMLVACLEGCLASAKNAQSRELLLKCGGSLIQVLNSFRPQPGE